MKREEKEVPLQDWAIAHKPADTLIYKDGYWYQIAFVRDTLVRVFSEQEAASVTVVSNHRSKSVCLPVFRIKLTDGTVFTMRNNFYDWKVSVSSPRDIEGNFADLFDPNKEIAGVYCEGFPSDSIYGSYAKDKRRFTIELHSDNYHIFTFFWLIARLATWNSDVDFLHKKPSIARWLFYDFFVIPAETGIYPKDGFYQKNHSGTLPDDRSQPTLGWQFSLF